MTASANLETRNKIPPPRAFYRILFWGHITGADQNIFTKFGV